MTRSIARPPENEPMVACAVAPRDVIDSTDFDAAASVVSGVRRVCYVTLGGFFVVLGGRGVVLPVLPTTPFLLLASFFFVRSSPALDQRMLRSRWFGPLLRDWRQRRGVRRHVKIKAAAMILLVASTTLIFARLTLPLAAFFVGLIGVGLIVVLRLPAIDD